MCLSLAVAIFSLVPASAFAGFRSFPFFSLHVSSRALDASRWLALVADSAPGERRHSSLRKRGEGGMGSGRWRWRTCAAFFFTNGELIPYSFKAGFWAAGVCVCVCVCHACVCGSWALSIPREPRAALEKNKIKFIGWIFLKREYSVFVFVWRSTSRWLPTEAYRWRGPVESLITFVSEQYRLCTLFFFFIGSWLI